MYRPLSTALNISAPMPSRARFESRIAGRENRLTVEYKIRQGREFVTPIAGMAAVS
jgi:hypothetical protein